MLLLIVILTVAAVYVEIKLVKALPWLGKILEHYPLAALGFSLVLSMVLGSFFGAAGLIVFAAGICSTVGVQPYYRMRRNGSAAKINLAYQAKRERLRGEKETWMRRGHQASSVLQVAWFLLSSPFRLILWLMDRRASRTI